jgi:serine/threonine protein kinase/formylglycine-generating enzyme required for sulfatase activity
MPEIIGKSLGRYHILEQIGEGGMAIVYKAFDTRLEREVAVKVIRIGRLAPDIADKALKRFEREGKALARLNHPNIISIIDYGDDKGHPYLVMPFLPGGTLKEKLRAEGKIGWKDAARLLLPVAKALAYAHEEDMIHRDVKPANILITRSGDPMLTDFGIAKIIDEEATMDLTGTRATVGTPEYMAPEQVTAKTVDHRADIYALGVVFYEMITGRRPFQADTPMAVLVKLSSEPLPRPTEFTPNLPKEIEQALLKAMAKDPNNRFQSMGEFVVTLEKLLQGKFSAPSKASHKRIIEKKTPQEKSPLSKALFPMRYLWFILGGVAVVSILLGWLMGGGATKTPTQTFTPPASLFSTKTPVDPTASIESTHRIVVEANKKWNDTGIVVQVGDIVQITYTSGRWRSSSEYSWVLGDNCDDMCDDCLLPTASEGSLVAKIGKGILFCGLSSSVTSKTDGNLFLSFNDCPGTTMCFDDNEGSLEIQVDVISDRSTLDTTSTHVATATPELGIGATWERPADGMTMHYIPAGEFKMGSDDGEKDEKPLHTVYLDAYWIDQTEVTNTMYAQCWQEKTCNLPTDDKYIRSYEYRNHPVVYISWEDASTYCEWTGTRLPTEAEWEKAARGNINGGYPWGSVINWTYANYNGNEGNTQPVGVYSRSRNVYGLDDMAGNVWEFTADWYSSDYYSISPTRNPTGPEQGDLLLGDRRVVRGGSWGSTADDLRVFSRHLFDPTSTAYTFGFRCARDAGTITQE